VTEPLYEVEAVDAELFKRTKNPRAFHADLIALASTMDSERATNG